MSIRDFEPDDVFRLLEPTERQLSELLARTRVLHVQRGHQLTRKSGGAGISISTPPL